MNAFKVAGEVLDLPALLGADLFALDPAARAGPLLRAQLVDVGGDGEVFEVGQVPPAFAPPHAPQFIGRFRRRWNILGVNRLAVHLPGEVEQHLGHFRAGFEPVRARAVIPLLVALQFLLQAQHLDMKVFGALLFAVALQKQRAHNRLQRFAVLG